MRRTMAALALVVAGGCMANSHAAGSDGWTPLFDGRTTAGWRGYKTEAVPGGWQVVDGALTRVGGAAAAGGDIVTARMYRDFELELDWMVKEGGNSGIFYRGAPGQQEIYLSAPEMQVLDDARHPDGKDPLTSAGSVFGLYPVPRGVSRPAGQWNHARVVVKGNHVEHWLNGTQVASYELHSSDWKARVAASKFKAWPTYGQAAEGYIGLQDHGDWVAFRNIRIRVLP